MQQLTDQLLNFGTLACLLVCQLVYLLIFILCPAYDLFSRYSFIIQKVQFSFLKIPIYYFHFTLLTLVSFLESFTVIKYQNSKLMLYDNYSCGFIYIFYVFFVIFLKTSYYKKGSNEETTCVITPMTSA